jgi:multimeric flavodoxin WrbA
MTDMKKVLSIIGSPQSETSNTRALVEDFLASISRSFDDFSHDIIMLGDKEIAYCRGCYHCAKTGDCIIDDDLAEIKRRMLRSDLIILGSPVFMKNVSGQMKALFDRLFLWMHLMSLIGKPFIAATTTAYSGQRATERYIIDTGIGFGMIHIGTLKARGCYESGHFPDREKAKGRYRRLAVKTAEVLNESVQPKPGFRNSWQFTGMKKKAQYGRDFLPYEYDYWQSKGWFKLSYREALKEERLNTPAT